MESPHLKLDYYGPENDPSAESSFTFFLNYAWATDVDGAAHPPSVQEIRKKREAELLEVENFFRIFNLASKWWRAPKGLSVN